MNQYQQSLYTNLIQLVQHNEAFYYQDFYLDNKTYRIFNYRLASYTDFLKPDALECRGVTFEVESQGSDPLVLNAVRLVSLPMSKFFNLNENPSTMNLDLTEVTHVELKADGSLISTYIHNGQLRLKSKGSLFSDQAIDAMKWLNQHEQEHFRFFLEITAWTGYTVNMEWTAPNNRIVIGYVEPRLTVLNVRRNEDGTYVSRDSISSEFLKYWIDVITINDPVSFVNSIPDVKGVEGYILTFKNGLRAKCKGEWYLSQHRAKDSINSDRRLFETVLDEAADDLRSLFFDDPLVLQRIDDMESKVKPIYNHVVSIVQTFYDDNKHLDRKSYAIKGQNDVSQLYFGLVMSKYLGKDVDVKQFMKKHYKDFGIKDDMQQPAD